MVEVSVQGHVLARLPGLVGDANQSVRPLVGRVDEPARRNRESFGGEPESLDVRHADEPVADLLENMRLQVIRIAPRDHDVVKVLFAGDVV